MYIHQTQRLFKVLSDLNVYIAHALIKSNEFHDKPSANVCCFVQ